MEKQQKVAAIICEYNPFHYGHMHQIQAVKQKFDTVVGIMSGPFVQRGSVAVADKYSRAAAAIEGGMDLVVELPYPYCATAARDFATAGVHIAAALGADTLAFGCEDAGDSFWHLAQLIEGGDLHALATQLIKKEKNLSYPRALTNAAETLGGAEVAAALVKPNNILGAEYTAAISRGGYSIKPYPIPRDMSFMSSTKIRAAESFGALIPFPQYFEEPRRDLKYVERWIIATLRQGVETGELYGVDAPLAAALRQAAMDATDLQQTVALATGKVYTAARVRRGILAAWLGIKTEQVKTPPCYTTLLAANKKGLSLLKQNKKAGGIPVITKPAAYKRLCPDPKAFKIALQAEELAAFCLPKLRSYTSPLCETPRIILQNVQ